MTYSLRQRFRDREAFEKLQADVNEARLMGHTVDTWLVRKHCNQIARGSYRKLQSMMKRLGLS